MTITLSPAEASEVRAALRARVLYLRGSLSGHKATADDLDELRRREKLIEALLERISPATARNQSARSAKRKGA